MRTFLELIQQAANELGIPQPSQIVGAVDDQSLQLLALANREGKDFSVMANGNGGWQNLHKEYTFTTQTITTTGDVTSGSAIITNIPSTAGIVAGTWAVSAEGIPYQAFVASVDSATQVTLTVVAEETFTATDLIFGQVAYDLPSDFEYFTQKTWWDGAYRWQLLGPISAQEKQVLRYGISPVGPRRRFYVRVNKLWLDPVPTEETLIAYDYFSNGWCESDAGVAQSRWQADTDVYKLDEDCFIQGIKWRFLRAKGLDYLEEKAAYDSDTIRVQSRDGGNRDLPVNATASNNINLLSNANVPDVGYGQ
jgi:hypothetical protein